MKNLQKLGKALMLPVAVLPICGILMGLGYALAPAAMGAAGATEGFLYVLGFFLIKAGGAVIDNMAILFAVGVAVGLAESEGLRRVLLANHGGDHAIYPDCRPEFVGAMDAAARAGTYAGVSVEGPYTNLTKADIARRGKALGIDYAETWSCYKGGERHCGRCGTCVERREALAEAGITDTTEYES